MTAGRISPSRLRFMACCVMAGAHRRFRDIATFVMAGTSSAKTRFALLPGHDELAIAVVPAEAGTPA
jgi:hypothetical protein